MVLAKTSAWPNWKYQQDLFGNKITLGLGWSPVGDDFATIPIFVRLSNTVLCGHTNAMSTNSRAQNFPAAEWGAHITVHPVPNSMERPVFTK